MVIKDYIGVEDAKMTVEKLVKRKPTIQELTSVISPGKPTSTSMLESPTPKKRKTPRKKKSTASAKDITQRDFTLIITEKPQAALKIASALADSEVSNFSENHVPYYELTHKDKKIIVASAVGHLFNLTYKKGQKGFPVFDLEWVPSYTNSKFAAFTKRYFDVLKKLSKRASEFVVATDFDNEGEVIGWNVLRFLCNQTTAKRMKYSTLTKPELVASYESPLKELAWGQAYAGETRHVLDWLYGINLSRALMSAIKTQGAFKILSIGRVQGPALKIIVDREREITNFKSEPFWRVFALKDKIPYKHPKDIFDKTALDSFKDLEKFPFQAETKTKQETIPPQAPFDLTSLQREAFRLARLSPSETLKIAQKIYLDGLISYPRTSSQKIPDSINPKAILSALSAHFPEVKIAKRKIPIEGKKSDPAHPSIFPTGDYKRLEEDELKLYNIIAKRFIACFSPDAITENKHSVLTSEKNPEITFTASGLKIKEPGWTAVYPTTLEESSIPDLSGSVSIDSLDIQEKETQPPKRYTPTSLVTLLEKLGIGTKSTRSMIVDTLFDRGYIEGKSIQATPLGLNLIEALEKYSSIIIDPALTSQMEKETDKIQNSSSGFEEQENKVIAKSKTIITDIIKEFKANENKIGSVLAQGLQIQREQQQIQNELMPCPICQKGKLQIRYSKQTKRYFVGCSSYPECKATYSLPPNSLIKNTGKFSERNLPLLLAIRKGKRPWEFEFNPNWKEENASKAS